MFQTYLAPDFLNSYAPVMTDIGKSKVDRKFSITHTHREWKNKTVVTHLVVSNGTNPHTTSRQYSDVDYVKVYQKKTHMQAL